MDESETSHEEVSFLLPCHPYLACSQRGRVENGIRVLGAQEKKKNLDTKPERRGIKLPGAKGGKLPKRSLGIVLVGWDAT